MQQTQTIQTERKTVTRPAWTSMSTLAGLRRAQPSEWETKLSGTLSGQRRPRPWELAVSRTIGLGAQPQYKRRRVSDPDACRKVTKQSAVCEDPYVYALSSTSAGATEEADCFEYCATRRVICPQLTLPKYLQVSTLGAGAPPPEDYNLELVGITIGTVEVRSHPEARRMYPALITAQAPFRQVVFQFEGLLPVPIVLPSTRGEVLDMLCYYYRHGAGNAIQMTWMLLSPLSPRRIGNLPGKMLEVSPRSRIWENASPPTITVDDQGNEYLHVRLGKPQSQSQPMGTPPISAYTTLDGVEDSENLTLAAILQLEQALFELHLF